MSSDVVRKLRAPNHEAHINVTGVGGNVIQRSTRTAQLELQVPDRQTPITFAATCVRRLGIITPALPVDEDEISLWHGRTLADPQFGIPKPIDMLVGANLLPEILRSGNLREGGMIAQNTAFGWAISGCSHKKRNGEKNGCFASLSESPELPWQERLAQMLQRFWEMEDVPSVERRSVAHEACEKSFATYSRARDGRYIVRLPLIEGGKEQLGESEIGARVSLASLHRCMKRDPRFAAEYRNFMVEYLLFGHMERIPEEQLHVVDNVTYYIPHHGIWRSGDHGAKLRVVLDASRPTSSGLSLSDVMYPGPKLQTDIWVVLLRWRTHRVAFATDICMMFRQIWIDRGDIDLLRILWSPGRNEPVEHFRSLTVTYGTSSAPYLSLRVLEQLCADEGKNFPEAVEPALRDRYVDDILSGAHTVEEACKKRDQLIGLMSAGGFPLRKWMENRPELLQDLDTSECLRPTSIRFMAEGPVRELGIAWNPQEDSRPQIQVTRQSKRQILSTLASIFDPCGWLAPATLIIKLLLQDLWRA